MSPLPIKQLAFHSGGAHSVRRPSLLGVHPLQQQQPGQQAHPSPAAFQGFRKRERFVTGGNGDELETPGASQGFKKRHRFIEQPGLGALPASTPYREPSLSDPDRSQGSSKRRGCQLIGTGSQPAHQQMTAGSPGQQLSLSASGGSQSSQGLSKRNTLVRSASGSQPEPGNPPAGLSRRPMSAPAQVVQKTSMRQHGSEPLHQASMASPAGRAADAKNSLPGDQGMLCKAGESKHAPAPATAEYAQQAGPLPTAYATHYSVMGCTPRKGQHPPDRNLHEHTTRPLNQASMQQAAPGPAAQHHSSSAAIFHGYSNDVPLQPAGPSALANQQHSGRKEAFQEAQHSSLKEAFWEAQHSSRKETLREAQHMQAPSIPGPCVPGSGRESAHSEAAGPDSDMDSDADVPAEDIALLSSSISPALGASRGESGSR